MGAGENVPGIGEPGGTVLGNHYLRLHLSLIATEAVVRYDYDLYTGMHKAKGGERGCRAELQPALYPESGHNCIISDPEHRARSNAEPCMEDRGLTEGKYSPRENTHMQEYMQEYTQCGH